MLTVVTWLWSQPGFRTRYTPEIVLEMRDMVKRFYKKPHRFVCVTDQRIDGVETVRLGRLFSKLENPTWENGPSCYRRLIAFKKDAERLFGNRFVSIDLDTILLDDVTELWDRKEDVVLLKGISKDVPYCGAMFMMKTGCRPQVFDLFDPKTSPQKTAAAGIKGSDQAWISYVLKKEACWKFGEDIIDFSHYIKESKKKPDAKIVFFNGSFKPWDPFVRERTPWIKEAYQYEQETSMLPENKKAWYNTFGKKQSRNKWL